MTSQRQASGGEGVAPLAYLAARAAEGTLHRERDKIIEEADKSIRERREELLSKIEAAKAKLRDLNDQKWERVEKELTAYSRKSKLELMALAGGATKECLDCYEFYGHPDGECSETNCESSRGCPFCHRRRGYATHEQEHYLWVSSAEYGLYSCNMCSKLICGSCIVHHVDKCICLWQDKCGFRPPSSERGVGEREGTGCVEGYCGKKVAIGERQSCSAKGCELVSCAGCIAAAGGKCGTTIDRHCPAPTCKPCLEQRSRSCTRCLVSLLTVDSLEDFV